MKNITKTLKMATALIMVSLILFGCASVHVDTEFTSTDITSSFDPGNGNEDSAPFIEPLTTYYSDTMEALSRSPQFIVVDSVEKLSAICDFGSELAERTAFVFLATRQELEDAAARYGSGFFDGGFLIIIVGAESIGNMRYSVQSKTDADKIEILLSAVAPPVRTCIFGAYLYPVAFEGRYSGQEISISRTYSEERSSAA